MHIDTLRMFLLWCTVINYALLIFWWLLFTQAHDMMNRLLHRLGVRVPDDRIDVMQLNGITFYKLAIILFNLVPFIASCVVGR